MTSSGRVLSWTNSEGGGSILPDLSEEKECSRLIGRTPSKTEPQVLPNVHSFPLMALVPSASKMPIPAAGSDTLVWRTIDHIKMMDTLRLIKSSSLDSNVRPDLLRKNMLSAHHHKQDIAQGNAPCPSDSYFDGTRWNHQHSRSRTIPISGNRMLPAGS